MICSLLATSMALVFLAPGTAADPLPDGAVLRLGGPAGYCVDHHSAFSPDGKWVATGGANPPVTVWDGATGKQLHTHTRPGSVHHTAWTKAGNLVAVVFYGFFMCEWVGGQERGPDEKRMTELYNSARNGREGPNLYRTALAPDGRRAAATFGTKDADRTVVVFPFTANMPSKLVQADHTFMLPGCDFIGFSGDGDTLFAVQSGLNRGGRVTAYDMSSKKPDEPAWVLDLPPDEQKYIEQDGKKIAVQGKGWPSGVLSADGKRVVVEFPYGTFEVWDAPKAKKLYSWNVPWYGIPGNAEPALLAVSPDGKWLAVSSRQKTGLVGGVVYDLDTGKEAVKLAAGPNVPRGALKYSPDGKWLYCSYQVWDAATGKDVTPAAGHRGRADTVLVSANGKTIVTAGADLTARGWDAQTGKELWRADFPVPVTLRRVGADAAAAGEQLWHTPLEKPLLTLSTGTLSALPGDMGTDRKVKTEFGERAVRDDLVALSPDGKTAVTVDRHSPALKVWDWPKGTLRATHPFDPPEKRQFDRIDGATFTTDGKELVGLFVYPDAKPHSGRGRRSAGWRAWSGGTQPEGSGSSAPRSDGRPPRRSCRTASGCCWSTRGRSQTRSPGKSYSPRPRRRYGRGGFPVSLGQPCLPTAPPWPRPTAGPATARFFGTI